MRRVLVRTVFAVGVILYVVAQFYLVLTPALSNAEPVEIDDAYSYIAKAAIMQDCLAMDCPALTDLRPQLTNPSPDHEISLERWRQGTRLLLFYHPLYSFFLGAAHELGLSWRDAYNLIVVAGAFLLAGATAYWLYAIWGPGGAGIALVLLAFTTYPRQGLDVIIPSNITLGLSMLLWGVIIRRRSRLSIGLFALGLLILLFMHTIGRLYGLVAVAIFFLLAERPLSRRSWMITLGGLALIGLYFVLPAAIQPLNLVFERSPAPPGWTEFQGFQANLVRAEDFVMRWVKSYGGLPVALVLLAGLLLRIPPERARVYRLVGIPLFGLLVVSLGYIEPNYPALVFIRIWVPSAILLASLIGQTFWLWFEAVALWIRQSRRVAPDTWAVRNLSRSSRWLLALLVVTVGGMLGYITWQKVSNGIHHIRENVEKSITRSRFTLSVDQVDLLLAHSSNCRTVVYTHETLLYFYLANGALECGAVYYPALKGTSDAQDWILENPDIQYLVAWNPTLSLRNAYEGGFLLNAGEGITLHVADSHGIEKLNLYIDNPGAAARIIVRSAAPRQTLDQIDVAAGWSGWLASVGGLSSADEITLEVVAGPVQIRGIRSSDDHSLNWPWDQGINLSILQPQTDSAVEVNFDSSMLDPQGMFAVRVLHDGGSTVLAEIVIPPR